MPLVRGISLAGLDAADFQVQAPEAEPARPDDLTIVLPSPSMRRSPAMYWTTGGGETPVPAPCRHGNPGRDGNGFLRYAQPCPTVGFWHTTDEGMDRWGCSECGQSVDVPSGSCPHRQFRTVEDPNTEVCPAPCRTVRVRGRLVVEPLAPRSRQSCHHRFRYVDPDTQGAVTRGVIVCPQCLMWWSALTRQDDMPTAQPAGHETPCPSLRRYADHADGTATWACLECGQEARVPRGTCPHAKHPTVTDPLIEVCQPCMTVQVRNTRTVIRIDPIGDPRACAHFYRYTAAGSVTCPQCWTSWTVPYLDLTRPDPDSSRA